MNCCTTPLSESPEADAAGGCFDEAVLLDRSLDCVTPMCTQLTYEGLVDETLRIRNGAVTLDGPAGAMHGLRCMCQAKSRVRLHCSQRSVQSHAGSK